MSKCSVTECTREAWTAGLCMAHYFRVRRTGSVGSATIWDRKPRPCAASECPRQATRRGYCETHRRRLDKGGSVDYVRAHPTGPDNASWTGDAATYQTAHERLYRARGKARDLECACGAQAAHWAYQHDDPDERKSPTGLPYSLDPERYRPMCVPCHKRMDLDRR